MPNKAFAWLTRIKAVEREYIATRLATDRLKQHAKDDPAVLAGGLRLRDVETASDRLEGTYIIRLFAEFETSLRHFMTDFGYRMPRQVESLISRVRDRANVAKDHALRAHEVRVYRNTLVHDRLEPAPSISVREATSCLGTFLSWLQRMW